MSLDQSGYLAVDQNGNILTSPASLEDRIAALAAEMLDRSRLQDLPKVDPLIDGIYGRYSYIVLAGRNASYKSFIALDWMLCHATGKPWLGTHEVKQGRVLYLVGEGAYGLEDRIAAWEQHYGINVDPSMLMVLPRTPRLFKNNDELAALNEYVRREQFLTVTIDTLRRAQGEAKGNSNDDMGQVVDAIEDLKRATDKGSVVVVAHTDDGDTKVRGATNIPDDADYVYRTKKTGDQRIKLWRTKNKYGSEDDTHHLRATEVAQSLVMAVDGVSVMRMSDRDEQEAKLIYDFITAAGGMIAGFKNLKPQGFNNNRIKPAVTWLQDRGYIEIREKRPAEYVIVKDWSSDGGS